MERERAIYSVLSFVSYFLFFIFLVISESKWHTAKIVATCVALFYLLFMSILINEIFKLIDYLIQREWDATNMGTAIKFIAEYGVSAIVAYSMNKEEDEADAFIVLCYFFLSMHFMFAIRTIAIGVNFSPVISLADMCLGIAITRIGKASTGVVFGCVVFGGVVYGLKNIIEYWDIQRMTATVGGGGRGAIQKVAEVELPEIVREATSAEEEHEELPKRLEIRIAEEPSSAEEA